MGLVAFEAIHESQMATTTHKICVDGTFLEDGTIVSASSILLTEGDLSKRWSCAVRTLQMDRVKGGGVPYLKLKHLVRYRLSDVLSYENARLRKSTADRG